MTPSNQELNSSSAGGRPEDGGNGVTQQKFKEDAQDAKREVGARARDTAATGKHRLAEEADSLSDAIDAAASNLDDHDREGLARYAREVSSKLANAAEQLEGRSVDELASDAKRLARNNPALFMLGSIAIGFGLSRFFKASAERDHHDSDDLHRNDDAFRNDDIATGTPAQRREPGLTETHTTSSVLSGNGRDTL